MDEYELTVEVDQAIDIVAETNTDILGDVADATDDAFIMPEPEQVADAFDPWAGFDQDPVPAPAVLVGVGELLHGLEHLIVAIAAAVPPPEEGAPLL